MKRLFFLLLIASTTATAQNYQDSTITLQLTQRTAWWITKALELQWDNRKLPDVLRAYVGSGTRPDSLFTVTLRAGLVRNGMELLLTRPLLLAIDDYRSIVLNQPAITGYTALATQINTKANGNSSEKQVATWLRDWYLDRVATFQGLYNEEKAEILKRVN